MLKNVMVYLVGFSGTGKLTVARELALLLKARVVDNHWINNPILALIDSDRVTPFPEGVWDQIAKVRQAVLDTIATLSAAESNFIMTHAGHDYDSENWKIYNAPPVNEESIGTPALNGGKGRILWRPISAHASANLAG